MKERLSILEGLAKRATELELVGVMIPENASGVSNDNFMGLILAFYRRKLKSEFLFRSRD